MAKTHVEVLQNEIVLTPAPRVFTAALQTEIQLTQNARLFLALMMVEVIPKTGRVNGPAVQIA